MSPQYIFITLLSLLISFPVSAKIISSAHYKYPIHDPDEATVASSGLYHPVVATENISVNLKNRRLEGYHRARKLEARFYKSVRPTEHLIFVISGIGGNYKSGYSKFLAYEASLYGADAVIIPNVITENFVISTSSSGLVGGSAADANDLYYGLAAIKAKLTSQGRKYSRVSLVGYSHGALVAAFLEAADQRAKFANFAETVSFDSALLINPPIDLLHAIRTIDTRAKATDKIGFIHLVKMALRFKKMVSRYSKIVTTEKTHVEFSKALKLSARDRYGLIGKALTVHLPAAILATQAVNDLGILPSSCYGGSAVCQQQQRVRERKAATYGYEDYVTKFFSTEAKKTKKSPFSIDYLNRVNSLHALTETFRSSKNIYIMHNMDDPLLTNGQAYWLDQIFGDRALIFPTGGHLGNLWYQDNLTAFRQWVYYGRF